MNPEEIEDILIDSIRPSKFSLRPIDEAFMTIEVENLQKNNAPECQAFKEKASQSRELA